MWGFSQGSTDLADVNKPLRSTDETFLYFDGKPDRWVRTGDEVIFNEKLEIYVVDRIKVEHMFLTICSVR